MNHQIGQWIFALAVGLLVAFGAYRWLTDPASRAERQLEEAAVYAARTALDETLATSELELVDPLAPDRKIGKAYVYRSGEGWEVSGYYRRGDGDSWHPYLMSLDASLSMTHLKIRDKTLANAAEDNPALESVP